MKQQLLIAVDIMKMSRVMGCPLRLFPARCVALTPLCSYAIQNQSSLIVFSCITMFSFNFLFAPGK